MKATPIIVLFAVSMFLAGTVNAQTVDSGSMLGLELVNTQPTYYQDDEGYTVVIGEVNNLKDFPVTDVRILANFYTAEFPDSPHESQIGETILSIIPALESSPYMIRSSSQNLDIYGVSTNLLGFTSSAAKDIQLELDDVTARASDTLSITGMINNNAQGTIDDITVYALVYNALDPPRLIVIDSMSTGELSTNETSEFQFSLKDYEQASFVRLVAESDNYTSKPVDIPIMRYLAQPLVIADIVIVDADGNYVSSLHKDIPVYIQSRITGQNIVEIDYTYIIQVNRSDVLSVVEFVGTTDGLITDSGVSLSLVEWIPETSGLFFVETYVWSVSGTPLSTPGPVTLLHVR